MQTHKSPRFRYDTAQRREQLGEPAAALAEYRPLLPSYENQYVCGGDPELAHTNCTVSPERTVVSYSPDRVGWYLWKSLSVLTAAGGVATPLTGRSSIGSTSARPE
ncbi:hypothetical protein ACFZAV_38520 [Streptomyces sp. NPDC008343]|uniref:hypothetical protein n=1 Tax=Streptomyces sp. NPDC008343 TaxID=3364828 RepID=UPI0036E27684